MSFGNSKFFAARSFARLFLICVLFIGSSLFVCGQTINSKTPTTAPATTSKPSEPRADADETFELNITERRYSQENFEASTAIRTNGDGNELKVQVGVAVAAGRIDLLLRNVHGTVRFRGTLQRIFEVIGDRAASPATSPASNPRRLTPEY